MKRLLLMSTALAVISFIQPDYVLAHGDEKHEVEHYAKEKQAEHADHAAQAIPHATDAQSALNEINQSTKNMEGIIAGGKLDVIHEEVEKIEADLKTIQEKSGVAADKKTRLDSAIKQAIAQVGKVHNASDSGDKEKTSSELNKFNSALKLVEAAMK